MKPSTPTHSLTGTPDGNAATAEAAPPVRIGWTTLPSQAEAEQLAQAAVRAGHAACAQVSGPVTSYYHWQGEFCRGIEWRVTFKFPVARAAALEGWLLANHPYETPQWIAVDATQISPAYHAWLLEAPPCRVTRADGQAGGLV